MRRKLPTLRCKDCGAVLEIEEDAKMLECDCGSVWLRGWRFQGEATVDLWIFYPAAKPVRRMMYDDPSR